MITEIRGRVIALSSVKPRNVKWLSPGRIPFEKIAILEGDPGLGKSTLLADLAARVTRGEGLPGDPPFPPRAVLILSAEDGLADTLRPRLDAAGADVDLVHALECGIKISNTTEKEFEIDLGTEDGRDAIEEEAMRLDAGLIVVDVFVAYLGGGTDSYRDQDIRGVLRPLKEVAERTGAAIVLVRHLRKGAGRGAIAAGGGSIGIAGAARSVLLVDTDPNDPDRRVLAVVKNNVAAVASSLSFRVVGADNGVGMIEWLGPSDLTSEALTASRETRTDGSEDRQEAHDLLRDWLADGPLDRKEVLRRGRDNGFSESTMDRAANRLRVSRKTAGFGASRRAVWSLPDSSIAVTEAHNSQSSHIEGGDGNDGFDRYGTVGLAEPSVETLI